MGQTMKLCAIYCVWYDWDILEYSVKNIRPVVDGIIIVGSSKSNYGNTEPIRWKTDEVYQWEPKPGYPPHENETAKRNYGLDLARQQEYTHFIMMDADEFYFQDDVRHAKKLMDDNVNGLVCETVVHFKKSTLYVNDHTLVPFIHRLTPGLKCGNFRDYPFAYDKDHNAHIDPTRRLNITNGVFKAPYVMHHFSWIRKDINVKIENSAARNNLKKSSIYLDWETAAPGVYNEFYRSELLSCDNYFNLPEVWMIQEQK